MPLRKPSFEIRVMKSIFLFSLLNLIVAPYLYAQNKPANDKQKQAIYTLIENYSQAREKQDTVLLKSILTTDVDQLVSSGEWRNGIKGSMNGMMRSSESNPGSRKLIVEKIRSLNSESAIVDARYEIQNADGTIRKMWSTFIVVYKDKAWKITAIRNMLPTGQ
jgi:hypothetical protein